MYTQNHHTSLYLKTVLTIVDNSLRLILLKAVTLWWSVCPSEAYNICYFFRRTLFSSLGTIWLNLTQRVLLSKWCALTLNQVYRSTSRSYKKKNLVRTMCSLPLPYFTHTYYKECLLKKGCIVTFNQILDQRLGSCTISLKSGFMQLLKSG